MSRTIIENVTGNDVTGNEPMTMSSLNRNFKRLLDNDTRLEEYQQRNSNVARIRAFVEGQTYSRDETVWFREYNDTTGDIDLYILKSLKDGNGTTPKMETLVDGTESFTGSGWVDQCKFSSLYNTYLGRYVEESLSHDITYGHDQSDTYHHFGTLSSVQEYDRKVMKSDLTNRNKDRDRIIFPYETVNLKPDNVIVGGFYRRWDNGLLEYDIRYRVGYVDSDTIESNTISVENSYGAEIPLSSDGYHRNGMYFMEDSDYGIFRCDGVEDFVANGVTYRNIGKQQNSYAGKIVLPVPFRDLSYMVFTDRPEQSVNDIVYVNKMKGSITALYIKPEFREKDVRRIAIDPSLVFRCQIVGRCKQ